MGWLTMSLETQYRPLHHEESHQRKRIGKKDETGMLMQVEPNVSANQSIESVKKKLTLMAASTEFAVGNAVRALKDRDQELAEVVRSNDNEIDRLEMEIDAASIDALGRELSSAELRLVTMAMKISRDLERVGDEATTIARQALALMGDVPIALPEKLLSEAVEATAMLRDSIDALVGQDSTKARTIIPRDASVDQWNAQLFEWFRDLIREDVSKLDGCLSLMSISRSLERIADHATNIAEEVVFYCEAKDIRHPKLG